MSEPLAVEISGVSVCCGAKVEVVPTYPLGSMRDPIREAYYCCTKCGRPCALREEDGMRTTNEAKLSGDPERATFIMFILAALAVATVVLAAVGYSEVLAVQASVFCAALLIVQALR